MNGKREPEFDPAVVRATSIAVYKMRLVAESGDGAVERMIAKDGDNGERLAGLSASYDALTRCYLRALSSDSQEQKPSCTEWTGD